MNISKVSTKELVEELSKREGIEKIITEPYKNLKVIVDDTIISDTGPAIILIISD